MYFPTPITNIEVNVLKVNGVIFDSLFQKEYPNSYTYTVYNNSSCYVSINLCCYDHERNLNIVYKHLF